MVIYECCRLFLHAVYRLLFRYEAYGADTLPDKGAVLLCANHISNWDPPLVGLPVKRRINFMAKQEVFKIPILAQIIRILGAFPVKRGATDKKAIRTALERLRDQEVVLIFPEGTRSKTGRLGRGMPGSGFLALKEECTVIPVAIIGPYRLFNKVKIYYGSPIPLDDIHSESGGKSAAQLATERIMSEIGRMIEEHRDDTTSNGTSLGNSV